MEHIELILASDVPNVGKRGEKVSLALTPADVHAPEESATYLAGYSNGKMRADDVSKVVLVDVDEDKYRSFATDDTFKRVHVKASHQSPIPEIDAKTSLDSYKVVDRLVGAFIPRVTELNARGAFKPRLAALRRCKNAIYLDREHDVWDMLTTTANWNANNVIALGAGANWNGGVSSNPIKDLMDIGLRTLGGTVDFWMNYEVASHFIRHNEVRDHFRMFNGDAMLGGAIAALNTAKQANVTLDFAIPAVGTIHIVQGQSMNAAGVVGPILGSTFVVATVSPPGVPTDGEEISTSYTFRRRGPSGTGFETREFFIENRGPLGGTMVVATMADVAKMTGPVVGGLLTGVTA